MLGRTASGPAPVRLNAETAPTRAKTPAPTGAAMRRLVVSMPSTAPKMKRKIVVPKIRAILSFCPNVAMANSLTALGTLSTTTLPTATTGDETELNGAATSSATPRAAPAAARPATRPLIHPPCCWRGPRSAPTASSTRETPGREEAESTRGEPDSWGVGAFTTLLRGCPHPRITQMGVTLDTSQRGRDSHRSAPHAPSCGPLPRGDAAAPPRGGVALGWPLEGHATRRPRGVR